MGETHRPNALADVSVRLFSHFSRILPIARGIDIKRVYPLLLVYGASTTTTLLPCLSVLFSPSSSSSLTFFQTSLLLSSYIPFLSIPLTMAVDMALRWDNMRGVMIKSTEQKRE